MAKAVRARKGMRMAAASERSVFIASLLEVVSGYPRLCRIPKQLPPRLLKPIICGMNNVLPEGVKQ